MFYKFSQMTGRIGAASQQAAFRPEGVLPLTQTEAPPLIFGSPVKPAGEVAAAPQGKPAIVRNKVPEMQQIMQKPGNLLFVKRGGLDTVLYRGTMGLVVVGVVYACFGLFQAMMPKKSED
ncbi:PREDICTED: cytochrome c oxidase subunit 7A-related protein, mitochondrial-like isoform X2 [Branchiostoma belcheri]|uniref:Cytochrome c oxidase subunit 7A-related protein, mitochondrial-like isoform X1 n=1 Tax=Branchiostoma belcheri TaxID=7741 RepID=A0A6P4ZM93_BRABE|nr:PREDICTED: cytochrome c oxidase subunit 7A-related protein, mitochondrial-like isoform X1 [Branchiostoma belcheri]XP_019642330.1 PREDICTED: cytochrome c oxidase subunit 7A-related protein, mitochondrial-like isoform X2 [Branchiostoma belcheri]KAI8479907.1 Cytochrome c oxidase subunit 7A- protein, mitochondrial [Branchiostoma belcheri]KAI8486884.1 Cytochrome c oxidase subunit 7A- protein, mitochondrial [Branchiostoma belcheri]